MLEWIDHKSCSAPEQVLANERKKEADALQKIAVLEEKLSSLN